jgi:hypothetical protein
VSRGLGVLQRGICEVLYAAEDNKLPLRDLRRRLGEPDRSNLRRAIRGLMEREIVAESRLGGKRHVVLTFWGCGYVGFLLAARRRPAGFEIKTAEARRVVVGRPGKRSIPGGMRGMPRGVGRSAPSAASSARGVPVPRRDAFCMRCGSTPILWKRVCQ